MCFQSLRQPSGHTITPSSRTYAVSLVVIIIKKLGSFILGESKDFNLSRFLAPSSILTLFPIFTSISQNSPLSRYTTASHSDPFLSRQ